MKLYQTIALTLGVAYCVGCEKEPIDPKNPYRIGQAWTEFDENPNTPERDLCVTNRGKGRWAQYNIVMSQEGDKIFKVNDRGGACNGNGSYPGIVYGVPFKDLEEGVQKAIKDVVEKQN